MELTDHRSGLLNMLVCPAFTANSAHITAVNASARGLLLAEGMPLEPLIGDASLLEALQDGCLYLSITHGEEIFGAEVTRANGELLFVLDTTPDTDALRALALAATQLREPLSGLMSTVESLHRIPEVQEQAAMMERRLNQLLRMVCNMSDAGIVPSSGRQEVWELNSFFREIFEKAAALTESTGVQLTYTGTEKDVYSLCDSALLQRAVLNILSNSLKFTPAGGSVHAELLRHGKLLELCVTDSGSGIAQELRSTLFRRYLRQPALEEERLGLGLGMLLVRTAAMAHGGAVLVDQPEGKGTRVTLTMQIRQDTSALRSDFFRVDYAGERDHALLELSDVLPPECYKR